MINPEKKNTFICFSVVWNCQPITINVQNSDDKNKLNKQYADDTSINKSFHKTETQIKRCEDHKPSAALI